jgi:hypothetical protein
MAQAEKHTLDVDADDRVEHVLVILGGVCHLAFHRPEIAAVNKPPYLTNTKVHVTASR